MLLLQGNPATINSYIRVPWSSCTRSEAKSLFGRPSLYRRGSLRRSQQPLNFQNGSRDNGQAVIERSGNGRRFPESLEEVDNGKILGFGADLAEDHPGYKDQAYKDRRTAIANLARQHRVGEPVPHLDYQPEELHVWSTVLQELRCMYADGACKEFLQCFPLFGFREDEVPQLEALSQILKHQTGWQIRPVAGLLHPRDFLNGLAFRTFHSTQYMRHPSRPMYTPEPDVCHELLGHVPMLAHPAFCDLVHSIGIASLCADDSLIWRLTKIYWSMVEFGVVKEGNEMKAFGAGILSSYGEMEHMRSSKAEFVPFDPWAKQAKMSYKDGYQKQYSVLESFEDGAQKLREYCASITPPDVMERFINMMGNA